MRGNYCLIPSRYSEIKLPLCAYSGGTARDLHPFPFSPAKKLTLIPLSYIPHYPVKVNSYVSSAILDTPTKISEILYQVA